MKEREKKGWAGGMGKDEENFRNLRDTIMSNWRPRRNGHRNYGRKKIIMAPNLPKSLKGLKYTDSGVSVNPKEHKYKETQHS